MGKNKRNYRNRGTNTKEGRSVLRSAWNEEKAFSLEPDKRKNDVENKVPCRIFMIRKERVRTNDRSAE